MFSDKFSESLCAHTEEIAIMLTKRQEKVSVAESSTGGLISASLLSVAGASRFYEGGSVIYTLPSRRAYLDLDKEKVRNLKPLTEEMVLEFAKSAQQKLGVTWGIAELGAAGPTGTAYGHEPGISVIGISGPVMASKTILTGSSDRVANMQTFSAAALELFHSVLKSLA